MKIKTNRQNFYEPVLVDGVEERDIINNRLSDLPENYGPSFYRIQETDLQRPDIISKKLYGTSEYWWIILEYNPQIQDIWNDMIVGDIIKIPSRLDIMELLKRNIGK